MTTPEPDTPDIFERTRRFAAAIDRMHQDKAELTAQYPDRWVAVTADGFLAVGDSTKELVDVVRDMGYPQYDTCIEFLHSKPPILIPTIFR